MKVLLANKFFYLKKWGRVGVLKRQKGGERRGNVYQEII